MQREVTIADNRNPIRLVSQLGRSLFLTPKDMLLKCLIIVAISLLAGCSSVPEGEGSFHKYLHRSVVGKDFHRAAEILKRQGFHVEYDIQYVVKAIYIKKSNTKCKPFTFLASSCDEEWSARLIVDKNVVVDVDEESLRYHYSTYLS